jgi:HK97 family phage portal protein
MWPFNKEEPRASTITQAETDVSLLRAFGLVGDGSITTEQALQVPAVWDAINFISGTIAGLPLQVFDKKRNGERVQVKGVIKSGVGELLGKNVNDFYSSFQWRYDMFSTGVLPEGRFVTYIERDNSGAPINLFPIAGATCEIINGLKVYKQKIQDGKDKIYAAADVIDITFMLKADLATARSPLRTCSTAIAKAYHANAYGAKLFKNGGLPSFVLQGPFGSEKAAVRGSANIEAVTKEAAQNGANVIAVPLGHKLEALGFSPDQLQMIETQKHAVLEVARIYGLPPTFLQDLSNGTFSNTEQQDLQLVKHTVKRWVEQIEAELNLKIFGRDSKRYAEFNLDGLMRGDFMSTMQGNAVGIQSGQITPNETRSKRNLPTANGGDQLFIQGATIPINMAGKDPVKEAPKNDE